MHIRMRTLLPILILAALALPAPGAAQVFPQEGSRIRISDQNGARIVGSIEALSIDDVTILNEANLASVRVPFEDIRKMEWNTSERPRFVKYFAISVLSIAAAVGTAAALMTSNECSGIVLCSPAENFVLGAMVGGGIGVPVGIIAGLSVREQEWLPVQLPRSGSVTLSVGQTDARFGGVVTSISLKMR